MSTKSIEKGSNLTEKEACEVKSEWKYYLGVVQDSIRSFWIKWWTQEKVSALYEHRMKDKHPNEVWDMC